MTKWQNNGRGVGVVRSAQLTTRNAHTLPVLSAPLRLHTTTPRPDEHRPEVSPLEVAQEIAHRTGKEELLETLLGRG